MNTLKAVALVLIVAGVLALVYGGFTYTKSTHETKIGPLELSIKDKETVNVPIWAGVGAIVVGGRSALHAPEGVTAPPPAPDNARAPEHAVQGPPERKHDNENAPISRSSFPASSPRPRSHSP